MQNDAEVLQAAREVVSKLVGRPVGDEEALISGGLIDSLAILRMIGELEGKLGKSIPTDSLQPDDFDTIALIVETVKRVTESLS
jgi:acyl carrier protein